jgi:alpha-beta hydrolase superfamily lysophospholipase
VAGVLGCLAAVALGAAGWCLSQALDDQAFGVDHSPSTFDLVVLEVSGGTVTLAPAAGATGDGWKTPGVYGLAWVGGYAQVSTIERLEPGRVVRRHKVFEGTLRPGLAARVDSFAYPPDPARALRIPFEEVRIPGPLGDLPAWFIDAPGDTFALMVHGQNASRAEMLRALRPLHELGVKALILTYRNDEGAPPAPDRRLHFGATEWEDIEAAAAYALDHGAGRLVLVGYSMGGGIVMSFLYRSPLAAHVSAVILDAPMLDFARTVEFLAPEALPDLVIDAGKWFTGQRFEVDWDALDYVTPAAALTAPILLFHGEADDRVPFATSAELAARRPDLVTLRAAAGVGHVRSWNADPASYEAAIRDFLGPTLADAS